MRPYRRTQAKVEAHLSLTQKQARVGALCRFFFSPNPPLTSTLRYARQEGAAQRVTNEPLKADRQLE